MLTRREFAVLAASGLVTVRLKADTTEDTGAAISSTVNGVRIGAQTYSFRDLPRPAGAADSTDVVIHALTAAGLTECELFAPQLEPQFGSGARGARGCLLYTSPSPRDS